MPIFAKGYERWKDPVLHGRPSMILTMFSLEMRLQIRRIVLWLFYACHMLLVAFIFFILWVSMGGLGGGAMVLPPSAAPLTMKAYLELALSFGTPFLVAIIGTGTIARDRKHGAHLLFFSKGLTPIDYLIGKGGAVFLLIFASGLVPAVLFYSITAENAEKALSNADMIRFFLAGIATAGLFSIYYTGAVLFFSSLNKNQYLPGVIFFAAFFALWMMGSAYDTVAAVQKVSEMEEGEFGSQGSRPEIRDGQPVAVFVDEKASRRKRMEIYLVRPDDFDEAAWLETRPRNWWGWMTVPSHPGPDGSSEPPAPAWETLQVERVETEWTATPFEWLRVLNQYRLLGRTAEAFYPEPTPSKMTLDQALMFGGQAEPDIVLPWWQVFTVNMVLLFGFFAIVHYRLRKFGGR